MRILCIALVFLVSAACGSGSGPEPTAPAARTAVPAQARPVQTLLEALRVRDLDRFKSVYSKRMARRFAGEWQQKMNSLAHYLGDGFELDELSYSFDGDPDAGLVFVTSDFYEGKPLGLRVVREPDGWKVDEY